MIFFENIFGMDYNMLNVNVKCYEIISIKSERQSKNL